MKKKIKLKDKWPSHGTSGCIHTPMESRVLRGMSGHLCSQHGRVEAAAEQGALRGERTGSTMDLQTGTMGQFSFLKGRTF